MAKDEVHHLLAQAARLPHGPERIALTSRAVDLADTRNDVGLAMSTRMELIFAAQFGGSVEIALTAFAWCLGQYDRGGHERWTFSLLWRYKWIVEGLFTFPSVARSRINEMLADLGKRLAAASCRRFYHQCRTTLAAHMGDLDKAARFFPQWQRCKRDYMSDCPACDVDAAVEVLVLLGRDEDAVEKAKAILAGTLKCLEVPHRTLARLLLPLARLGRWGEAQQCHERGYPLVTRNPEFVRQQGMHLAYLSLSGKFTRAIHALERNLPQAINHSAKSKQFECLLSARLLVQQLTSARRKTVRLRLPRKLPLWKPEGVYPLMDLEAFFRARTDQLAKAFDTRNGNDSYARQIAETLALPSVLPPPPGK